MRTLYHDDILKTIEGAYKNGSISRDDMNLLINLTGKLFDYLYLTKDDMEEARNMLHDESLDLDIDRYIDTIEAQQKQLVEKDETIAEKNVALAEKDETIAEKDRIIASLKEKIYNLENN